MYTYRFVTLMMIKKTQNHQRFGKQNEEKFAPHKTAPLILSEGWKPKAGLSYRNALKMEKVFDVYGAFLLIYLLFITV